MEKLKKKLLIWLMKKELRKAERSWDSEENHVMKNAKENMCEAYKKALIYLEL